jgi:hypothetical protein
VESKVIFDVAMKSFDWQAVSVPAALIVGGGAAVLGEKFKFSQTAIKNVGYFLIVAALLSGGYMSIHWYVSRRHQINDLAHAGYQVVEGNIENFQPMYYDGRKEEHFTVSGRSFAYSDNDITTCFNQPQAHGGPIHAGMFVRLKFTDQCILRIEGP